ncbi:HsdR family type I site-specific deoxyribonuclease [Corynebacterium sp. sy017]|uniref:type I restriction endonuclease subunit R n=1 Tax=unclassified Corynebacterium TaxID=2624378 RepID=UPI001185EB9B|nr:MULTISPECIES: HsdR family type I site-specific deoxyribonuclease [unclassified Corynebacterium]MBP3089119.1 HsdR family type I site-specific deoxyribonuclease [Corynebacterium sp. sy017]TSD91433.1 HsdR family type I site-specific deoxyribonuclease [Corynebacterium sp. SY003]
MNKVGQKEIVTQGKVINLLTQNLGYEYLGDWRDRDNSNILESLLQQNLESRGYETTLIRRAVQEFTKKASLPAGGSLYEVNRKIYELLRYGVKVQHSASETFETVQLIDWESPQANHFAVAEEVTVKGQNTKRPDLVLYVNGIALGVIELKRSKVSVSEGIRQNIGNQGSQFIRSFFTTVQLLFAGNDVEGLRYGVIEASEKYWLQWKETSEVQEPLDREILQMLEKTRFLEIIHDFIVFDAGTKKTCRYHQYFAIKEAQPRIASREGGIIWHTQGSGKSLTMVWLAKWIRENQENARVLIITDRTELDNQIELVFDGVNESIERASSAKNLLGLLNKSQPWLICSLVHKFRGDNETSTDDTESFLQQLKKSRSEGFSPKGNLFVFVDEAHRTQSGKLHAAMKELLPEAMFIGFTGTPLLKKDKAKSIETFGSYIHTYKFDEAVTDGVVLDLRYEARDIRQRLTGQQQIDKWFEARTKGMTDLTKSRLKQRWATIREIESSEPRVRMIAQDIIMDMDSQPRLSDGRGNAILVCSSVYQACKFYEIFSKSPLTGKIAIITSYEPTAASISKEDSGLGQNEAMFKYEVYRKMLSDYFGVSQDEAVKRIPEFEKEVKETFINHPGQMRLLIVVDKLLTGFDAPSATYLYIDKKMQDHSLFQAICRVNRLDGGDKDYGYIVDYRDLFQSINAAVDDYTSGAFDEYEKEDIEGLLKNRVEEERRDLEEALEYVQALCEPVAPPRGTLQFQQYFCAKDSGNAQQLKDNELKRVDLYKGVSKLVRAFANIANKMAEAGYSTTEAQQIRKEVEFYSDVYDEVKLGAGDNEDIKQFEAGIRSLLDTYVSAEPSRPLASFEQGLVSLIVDRGKDAIEMLPEGTKKDKRAVAETIVNNVRKTIVDEQAMNPKYYEKMSSLLDELIEKRHQDSIGYEEYLEKLIELAQHVGKGSGEDSEYPNWANTQARQAFIDFAWPEGIVLDLEDLYTAIQQNKEHDWPSSKPKRKALARTIHLNTSGKLETSVIENLLSVIERHNEFQ